MEDKTPAHFGQKTHKGHDPDAPAKKPDDSGIDIDFDDESEAPSKSYRKRSFTEAVKTNATDTFNPQSVKASNDTKDHLPRFAKEAHQEVEMS